MANVHEAIMGVMQDVNSLGKNQKNTHQGFSFRGIDDVMQVFGPAMRKHGLICMPIGVSSTQGEKQVKNGTSKTVDLTVKYRWLSVDGTYVDSEVAAESFDSGDKATAKAMSVALRTLYLQTFCLPTNEPDPDSYSYEIAAPEDKDAFLERVYQIKDVSVLQKNQSLWATAKRLGVAKEYTEYGQKLKAGE